jgi:hypothetical protein
MGFQWVYIVSLVALNPLNFLQFFLLKSIEKWPSYTSCKLEGPSPKGGHMAWHLVSVCFPNLEIVQVWQLGLPKVPL